MTTTDAGFSSIRQQVEPFHRAFGQPVLTHPQFPDFDRFQLRLRLISEEFFELLAACNKNNPDQDSVQKWMQEAHDLVHALRDGAPKDADIVDVTDALADLDYVIEGTRLAFGINGKPIADLVHAANMAKRQLLPYCTNCDDFVEPYEAEDGDTACPGCWKRTGLTEKPMVVLRGDGKALKPEDWKPADIAGELRRQGWEG